MKKFLLSLGILSLGVFNIAAQDLNVSQIEELQFDIAARTDSRNDERGLPCALLKIYIPSIKEAVFEGDIVDTEYSAGEYKVYVPSDIKNIRIKHPSHPSVDIDFAKEGIDIKEKTTYRIVLQRKKNNSLSASRTLTVASNPDLAYVLLDGIYVGQTPLTLPDVEAGKHQLTIGTNEYNSTDVEVDVKEQGNTPCRIKLLKKTTAPIISEKYEAVKPIDWADEESGIFPHYNAVKLNGKWGVIDLYKDGKEIVECKYDNLDCAKGYEWGVMIIATLNGKQGLMSQAGELQCECKFEWITGFTIGDRLTYAELEGKMVLMNRAGEIIIHDVERGSGESRTGLILIKQGGKCGFIDETGKWIINPQFEDGYDFNESGFATVKQNGKWGCINTEGKLILPFEYDEPAWSSFVGGYTLTKGKYDIYIDKNGTKIERGNIEVANEPDARKRWKTICRDSNGEILDEEQFLARITPDTILPPLVPFMNANGKYGYANKAGEIIIPAICDGKGTSFDEDSYLYSQAEIDGGLYFICVNGKYAIIDKEGKQLSPFIYEDFLPFARGIAYVQENGKWKRISKEEFVQ